MRDINLLLLLVGGGVLVCVGVVEEGVMVEVGGVEERFIKVEFEVDLGKLVEEEKKFLRGWELGLEVGVVVDFMVLKLLRFEKFVIIGWDGLVIKGVIFRVLKFIIGLGCLRGGSWEFDWKFRGGKEVVVGIGWGVIFKSWFLKVICELGNEIGIVGVIGMSLFLSIGVGFLVGVGGFLIVSCCFGWVGGWGFLIVSCCLGWVVVFLIMSCWVGVGRVFCGILGGVGRRFGGNFGVLRRFVFKLIGGVVIFNLDVSILGGVIILIIGFLVFFCWGIIKLGIVLFLFGVGRGVFIGLRRFVLDIGVRFSGLGFVILLVLWFFWVILFYCCMIVLSDGFLFDCRDEFKNVRYWLNKMFMIIVIKVRIDIDRNFYKYICWIWMNFVVY